MKRMCKLGLFLSVSFLLILMVPIPVRAQTRDFDEDDIITFGYQYSTRRTVEIGDGKTDGYYSLSQNNFNVEITDLDSGDRLLDYTTWDSYGNEIERNDYNFDSDQTETIDLFSPSYTVDGNDVLLLGISPPSLLLFIDPDWDEINTNLANNIEDWETTLWVDGDDEIRDMDDFFDSCTSYSFMGESDWENGLDAFTDTNHRWYCEVTWDGDVYYFDWREDEYKEYNNLEIKWELEFTEGGTLTKYKSSVRAEDTGKFTLETDTLYQNKAVKLGAAGGGLIPGVTHAFEFPIMILAVVSSTIALRFVGKRRS
ncbi:MAG: hypothetical protein ACFFDC_09830 [Promethearchaeota archaeon]